MSRSIINLLFHTISYRVPFPRHIQPENFHQNRRRLTIQPPLRRDRQRILSRNWIRNMSHAIREQILTVGLHVLGPEQNARFLRARAVAVVLDRCVFPLVVFVREAVAAVGVERDGEVVTVKDGYYDHETDFGVDGIVPVGKGDVARIFLCRGPLSRRPGAGVSASFVGCCPGRVGRRHGTSGPVEVLFVNGCSYNRSNGELFLLEPAAYSCADIFHTRKRVTANLQNLEIISGTACLVIGVIGIIHT